MKPKFIIISLSSCSGCISALISLDIFPQFLERTKIIFFPFILDMEKIEDCDIALVEGCISEESEISLLKEVRKHSKRVFALGTCAAFGGLLSLSNSRNVEPISNYIEVDGIIPGCPPPQKLLGNILIRLIENKDTNLSEKTLCSSCPLRENMEKNLNTPIIKINPNPDEIFVGEENSECFLKRGILCLGPITREGCESKCIKIGLPCEGCMGPVSKEFMSNVINFLSLVSLSNDLKNYEGIFYRFSKPKLRR